MEKKKEKTIIRKKRKWFEFVKTLTKVRYKRPEFIYLGEEITTGGIIVSNHEGTDAPLSLELYLGKPVRMWGAHEMNSGLKKLYKYHTQVYFHEKKHWNIHLARLFCLIASPLTHMFYRGLGVISTYKDARFVKTLRESEQILANGENVVVFPEDSSTGYHQELIGFYCGFLMLGEYCLKKGRDVPIFITYFKKKQKQYVIDKPVMYSQLKATGKSREELAEMLVNRCNELGKMEF